MLRRISFIVLTGIMSWAAAGETLPAGKSLTDEQIRGATVSEKLSIPGPGEMFAAFSKTSKPDWSAMLRKSPSGAFTSRPQIALNLGTLIADGCLAVEAQDKQAVKNISREIKNLARSLGLEQDLVSRSNSITDFAEGRKWDALAEEFEAVQSELAAAMDARQDGEFVTLMSLGGWLRTMDIVSSHLATNYTPEGAGALRQPAVSGYFVQRLGAMPPKIQASPMMTELRRRLSDIQTSVSFPIGQQPSAGNVNELKTLTTGAVNVIGTPEK